MYTYVSIHAHIYLYIRYVHQICQICTLEMYVYRDICIHTCIHILHMYTHASNICIETYVRYVRVQRHMYQITCIETYVYIHVYICLYMYTHLPVHQICTLDMLDMYVRYVRVQRHMYTYMNRYIRVMYVRYVRVQRHMYQITCIETYVYIHVYICLYMCTHVSKHMYTYMYTYVSIHAHIYLYIHMGWLRLVSSLKLQVSFVKELYKRDYILQKRPIILRSLLNEATPCVFLCTSRSCTYK